ncbi:MAG: hypothetical protein JWN39_2942 [Ilumatobacteraceae bacterium]|nr:hypothetical protein [Ilumatobacteraceae bacterium]
MRRTMTIVTTLLLAGCTASAGKADPAPATDQAAATSALPAGEAPPTSDAPVTDASVASTADVGTTAPAAAPRTFGPMPGLAVVSSDGRVAMVRDGVMGPAVKGLLTADGSAVVATTATSADGKPSTLVVWQGTRTGAELGRVTLAGDLTAIATDPAGKAVAFTGSNDDSPGGTVVVVATPEGEQFRHAYDSELQPEGFSNIYMDGSPIPAGLFVIEYLDPPPADHTAPRRYRVRVADTASGVLALPLDLRDKGQTVDEQMLGFGRTHVLSPANGLLFTLYRGIDSDEQGYAFVHTLGFVNGVYCLDLPQRLDLAELPGAVALLDDESKLAVVSANGSVAEFAIADITDPSKTPAPIMTTAVWSGASTSGPAVAANGSTLLVGQDDALRWIDTATLSVRAVQHWDMHVEAVTLLPNGDAIAAGTGRISEITADGQLAAEVPLPADFGPVAKVVTVQT